MSNALVVYFSKAGQNYANGGVTDLAKGNTEVLAEAIAEGLGLDLYQIVPVEAYPEDYYACTDQAKAELRQDARPAIEGALPDLSGVDTIVLGYPNWWGTVPMPVKSFLDACDLSGISIAPFCTNEGSGLGGSVRDLAKTYPQAKVLKGLAIRGTAAARSTTQALAWARSVVG